MAKNDWDKLRTKKREEHHGIASVNFEGVLKLSHIASTPDPLSGISRKVDLPWLSPRPTTKSKVKGKKGADYQPKDRTVKTANKLKSR